MFFPWYRRTGVLPQPEDSVICMTTHLLQVFKSAGAEDERLKNIVRPVWVKSLVACNFCLWNTITLNPKIDVSKTVDS